MGKSSDIKIALECNVGHIFVDKTCECRQDDFIKEYKLYPSGVGCTGRTFSKKMQKNFGIKIIMSIFAL